MRSLHHVLLCTLAVFLIAGTVSAQSITLRLADGSRWTGEVGDHVDMRAVHQGREIEFTGEITRAGNRFLMVRTTIAGQEREFTLFDSDIRSIRTITPADEREEPVRPGRADAHPPQPDEGQREAATGPGVFVLPLEGTVGSRIVHQLIDDMVEYVDTEYGPGQIIVLKMYTPGGRGVDMQRIVERLLDARDRHRLIAWVDEAISAGCGIISVCHEIYFMTDGSAGAMTPHVGGGAIGEEQLRESIQMLAEWMELGNRHPYFAHAMVRAAFEMSYDIDPETGERIFYNDLSGEFILSRSDENLTLNSHEAVHSGFADGIADSNEELAQLLDLPGWREISSRGREINNEWHQLLDRAERDIPRLMRDRQRTQADDPRTEISRRIQITERLLRWARRLPQDVANFEFGLVEEVLERDLANYRRQLRQMGR